MGRSIIHRWRRDANTNIKLLGTRSRRSNHLPDIFVHLAVDALMVKERLRQLMLNIKAQRGLSVLAFVVHVVAEGLLVVRAHLTELHHLLLTVVLTRWLLLLRLIFVGLACTAALLEVLLEHAMHLVELVQGVLGRRSRSCAGDSI